MVITSKMRPVPGVYISLKITKVLTSFKRAACSHDCQSKNKKKHKMTEVSTVNIFLNNQNLSQNVLVRPSFKRAACIYVSLPKSLRWTMANVLKCLTNPLGAVYVANTDLSLSFNCKRRYCLIYELSLSFNCKRRYCLIYELSTEVEALLMSRSSCFSLS